MATDTPMPKTSQAFAQGRSLQAAEKVQEYHLVMQKKESTFLFGVANQHSAEMYMLSPRDSVTLIAKNAWYTHPEHLVLAEQDAFFDALEEQSESYQRSLLQSSSLERVIGLAQQFYFGQKLSALKKVIQQQGDVAVAMQAGEHLKKSDSLYFVATDMLHLPEARYKKTSLTRVEEPLAAIVSNTPLEPQQLRRLLGGDGPLQRSAIPELRANWMKSRFFSIHERLGKEAIALLKESSPRYEIMLGYAKKS